MKTLMILPYFGTFNTYFKLWLHSCSYQTDFDWLILTDQVITEPLPDNVSVVCCSLVALKQQFQKKVDVPLSLEKPYKLCDYKPFYGYLFSEYLQDYDYWGYCDCDLIFGDIRKYLTRQLQKNYDKCIRTGHFSVIKNSVEINTAFLKFNTYKIVLSSPLIYGYDESIDGYHPGFTGELIHEGFSFKNLSQDIADVDFRHFPFYEIHHTGGPFIYQYDKGKLYRIRKEHEQIHWEECMYVHLQKRQMMLTQPMDCDHFLILPNRFVNTPKNTAGTYQYFNSAVLWAHVCHEKRGYFHPWMEHINTLYRDFRRLCYEPDPVDCLKYRWRKVSGKYNEKNIHCSK